MADVSNHPSENAADPPATQVEAGTDPILIWYGLIKPRLDVALANVDQAYRDAKLAATNVDVRNRKAADARLEADPAGIGEGVVFSHESDALHRTHLKAMEVYAGVAGGLVSSIRDVMTMQQIELPEMVIE